MNDLIKFTISAQFINPRVPFLRAGELRYGYDNGWLTDADAVRVAMAGLNAYQDAPRQYEEIALSLSDELFRVDGLVRELETEDDDEEDASAVWLYLALAWVYQNRTEYGDPLQVVEMLFADFGYPSDIEPFVRFLPPPEGASVGVDALYDRWRTYLDRKAAHFQERRPRRTE